jgi:hypothetical protein
MPNAFSACSIVFSAISRNSAGTSSFGELTSYSPTLVESNNTIAETRVLRQIKVPGRDLNVGSSTRKSRVAYGESAPPPATGIDRLGANLTRTAAVTEVMDDYDRSEHHFLET